MTELLASIVDVYTSTESGPFPASNASVRTNFREPPDTPQESEV